MVTVHRPRERGITLLELLVSLGLSAIVGLLAMTLYRQGYGSFRQVFDSGRDHFQAQVFSQFLTNLVIQGRGLRQLNENGFQVITRDYRQLALETPWGDSVLFQNGKPAGDSICEFSATASGHQWMGDPLLEEKPPWDSLDVNGDGVLAFSDLDRNGDGTLDTVELNEVRIVQFRWRPCGEAGPWRQLTLSPRNKVGPTPKIDSRDQPFGY